VRPTSDRLKETLFNVIGPGLHGLDFLDVFAGSGAIGLEAISRGAREVVFIEESRQNSLLIARNLRLLAIEGGYQLLQQEAFRALRYLGSLHLRYDVVFMDPPYRWPAYEDLLDLVFHARLADEATRVILEHHRKSDTPQSGAGYQVRRVIRQGDHCLTFYGAVPSCPAAGNLQDDPVRRE
jgi:16S rRNA (guanine966-N2)-methyltransferase